MSRWLRVALMLVSGMPFSVRPSRLSILTGIQGLVSLC
jgi:hypothetical protein